MIGIAGSPRVGGNSHSLLMAALEGARHRGWRTELLVARRLSVQPCLGCDGCKRGPACVVDDDMAQVYDALDRADALVVATPVYYYGPSAWLKAIIDRTYGLLGPGYTARIASGKPLYVITTQEEEDPDIGRDVVAHVEKALAWVGMEPAGAVVGTRLVGPTDHLDQPGLAREAGALVR